MRFDGNARSRADIASAKDLLGDGVRSGSTRSGVLSAPRNESASREQFGVQERSACRSSDEIVREQSQLDVEQRAFTHASDDGSHAVAGVDVAPRLRAIVVVDNFDGMTKRRRQRGNFGIDLKVAQRFAHFLGRRDFLHADAYALKVTIEHRHAIAVRAQAEARINKTPTVPATEKLLRLGLELFFFAADERHEVGVNVHRSDAGVAGAGHGLQRNDENALESEDVGERLQDENEAGGRTVWIRHDEAG